MDQRDAQTWIVIELNHLGETKVIEGTLEASLRQDLGVASDFPIFIPVAKYPKGNRTITLHLMQGYVFVGAGLADTTYFALERRPYVTQIISTPGRIRAINSVPNAKIEDLRKELRKQVSSDLLERDKVRVTNGVYRNLDGVLLEVGTEMAVVQIQLRSLELVATIPIVFLEVTTPAGAKP